MSLWSKKKEPLPPLFSDAELSEPHIGNYESSLNYLIGLSDAEFDKVIKVAGFHRKAYQESAGVLGTPNEPTTFITPPAEPEAPADELNFLTEEDDKPKSKARNRKIDVKE